MSDEDKKEPEAVPGKNQQNGEAETNKIAEPTNKQESEKSKLLSEIKQKLGDLKREYSGKPDDFRAAAESLLQSYSNLPPEIQSLIENTITQAFNDTEAQKAQANGGLKGELEKTPEEKFTDEIKKLKADTTALIARVDALDEGITKTTNAVDQIEKDLAKTSGPPTDQQRKDLEQAQEELKRHEEEHRHLQKEKDRIQAELEQKEARLNAWMKELHDQNTPLDRTQVLEPFVKRGSQEMKGLHEQYQEFDKKHRHVGTKLQKLKDAISHVEDLIKERMAKRAEAAEVKKGESKKQGKGDIEAELAKRGIQQSEQGSKTNSEKTSVDLNPNTDSNQSNKTADQTQTTKDQTPVAKPENKTINTDQSLDKSHNQETLLTRLRKRYSGQFSEKTISDTGKMINGFNKKSNTPTQGDDARTIDKTLKHEQGKPKTKETPPTKGSGKPKNDNDKGGRGR